MKKIVLLLLLAITSLSSFAQTASKRVAEYNLEKGIAIKGYDPVAYYKEGKPLKGKPTFTAIYKGIKYLFSSQTNRDLFIKTPDLFEPLYGGWCAYAMGSSGEKVEIDPGTFKIVNSKLFLFYNAYFNNTLKFWNKDEASLNKKADANWKKFIN